MKLGNSSRAMGVGAYFLKVFLQGWLDAASCSVLESEYALLGCKLQSENALGSEQVDAFWGVRASCNL